jgi:hypothetical protein
MTIFHLRGSDSQGFARFSSVARGTEVERGCALRGARINGPRGDGIGWRILRASNVLAPICGRQNTVKVLAWTLCCNLVTVQVRSHLQDFWRLVGVFFEGLEILGSAVQVCLAEPISESQDVQDPRKVSQIRVDN